MSQLNAAAPKMLKVLKKIAEAEQTSLRRNQIRHERDDYVIASSLMREI